MTDATDHSSGHLPSHHVCPRCGRPVHKIHRGLRDRLVSVFYPVGRYHCRTEGCGWEGLLHQSRTASERSRTGWIVAGALLVALLGLATALLWPHDEDAMPVPKAPARAVARAPVEPDIPRGAAPASADESRHGCVWEGPGESPYFGTLADALAAARVPIEIARKIEIMRDSGFVTDRLEISSVGIRSTDHRRFFGKTTKAMAMGETVCFSTRIGVPPDKISIANLYELVDDTNMRFQVMVVQIGGNVAVLEE
jgi:predicted RNA-binding Zn-ribbon protein involved in translation (DUF1610 family)